jgi:hypothetical protein
MRLYRSDAGWQEREKDIRADAVIVSMSPDQAIPRHGCIPAEPVAVSPGKIIVPRIVIGGVIFEQACWPRETDNIVLWLVLAWLEVGVMYRLYCCQSS